MHVFQAGDSITYVQFLPDGERLLIGTEVNGQGGVSVHPLFSGTGDGTPFELGTGFTLERDNQYVVMPDESIKICWEKSLTGLNLQTGEATQRNQYECSEIICSPDKKRFVSLSESFGYDSYIFDLHCLTNDTHKFEIMREIHTTDWQLSLAGFIDNDRFVVCTQESIFIHDWMTGEVVDSTKFPANSLSNPILSPDRRYLAVSGYSSLYIYDLHQLGKPRRIKGSSAFGNFVSYAFNPDMKTFAVVYGGPTLVKIFDLETLKQECKFNWKVGKLSSVAFSPDGGLGAAGSEDGRVVIWDVEA